MAAFVGAGLGRSGLQERCTVTCTRARRSTVRAVRDDDENPGPIRPQRGPFGVVGDVVNAFRRLVGVPQEVDESLLYLGEEGFEPMFEEEAPTVLVVGATGEVGRIVVRKLLLRGYKVRVLVRNLFSSTLDLLGTGCGYVMGDLEDPYSLMEAVSGVDKVVCAVKAREPAETAKVELDGIKNLVRAFHDSRHADYGRSEATKVTLFKFDREKDFRRWSTSIGEGSDEDPGLTRKPAKANFLLNSRNKAMFVGQVFDTYTGHAEVACIVKKLNMRGFSGFILRCLGDGKQYRLVLRTGAGDAAGVTYEMLFRTLESKWTTVRLPLASFKARSNTGGPVARELEEVDRSDIRALKLEYRKPLTNPERESGLFSLTLDYMKAYRTQDEADFVLVSCSKVTEAIRARIADKASVQLDASVVTKFKSEEALRNSGISYCIVRSGQFTEQTGGTKALVLEQNSDAENKEISRTDLAEVCVAALQDPRARNVTFDAYESFYAPTAVTPTTDIGNMLEGLRPNS